MSSGGPASCTFTHVKHLLEDMPCTEDKQHHIDALHEVLHVLQNAWSEDTELEKRDLTQFGFCSLYDVQYSQFSSLITEMVQRENKGLELLHSRKGTGAFILYDNPVDI